MPVWVEMKSTVSLTIRLIAMSIFLAVLLFNREAVFWGYPPVYITDIAIVLIMLVSRSAWRGIVKNWAIPALFALALIWLGYDLMTGHVDLLTIRRMGIVWYGLCAVVITIFAPKYYRLIARHTVFLSLLVTAATALLPNIQATLSATVLGFFLLIRFAMHGTRRIVELAIIAACFVVVAFGFIDLGNSYRTPLLGLGLAVLVIFFRHLDKVFRARIKWNRITVIATVIVLGAGTMFVLGTGTGRRIAADGVVAVYGITGDRRVPHSIEDIVADQYRARGSAYGTAKTRLIFWRSIVDYNALSVRRELIGNGSSESFFQATRPFPTFVSVKRLFPHNAFMTLYFQYGIIGLILYLMLLYQSRKNALKTSPAISYDLYYATAVLALAYVFFNVSLEVPQGAVIFWTIWLSPFYLLPQFNAACRAK